MEKIIDIQFLINGGYYRACAAIYVNFPADASGNAKGGIASGFMIGKNLLLTAAHCVYDSEKKQFIERALVMPGMNGAEKTDTNPPAGTAWGVEVRIKDEYRYNQDPNWDWALIILDRDIGLQSGYLGFTRSNSSNNFLYSVITVSGYPEDKPEFTQWACDGVIKKTTEKMLFYNADTINHQSGSPIITYHNGEYTCIGVHAYGQGAVGGEYNAGPNINPWTYDFLLSYKEQ